jgi:hypothetical protein
MSFTDLASLARNQQQTQPPPMQAPQPQGNDPGAAPDPRSFQHSPTNPASVSTQVASLGGTPQGLESDADLGDVSKTKDKTPDPNAATTEPANYPPVIFPPSNYRAPAADRGPDGWGQKSDAVKMAEMYPNLAPGPDIPQPNQMYRESADASANMARYGAPGAAQLYSQASFLMSPFASILDALSKGNFSRNYTAAALRGLEIRQREAILKTEQAMEQHQQYLSGFGSIFKLAEDNAITPERAMEMTRQYINQIQHGPLQAEFERDGLRGVARYLNWEDAQLRRNMGAMAQARKVVDVDADKRDLDALAGRPSGAGGDLGALGIDPNRLPGRGGPEAPVTPTKDQSDPTKTPQNAVEQSIIDNLGLSSDPAAGMGIINAARARMVGEPDPYEKTLGNRATMMIGQAQQALQSRIDQVGAFNDPKMNPEELSRQKLDAVRRLNPLVAQRVQGLKNLQIDPKEVQLAGGGRERAVALTGQIYPGWEPGMYDTYQRVWKAGNSPQTRWLQAAGRATSQAVGLEATINRLPIKEADSVPATVWQDLYSKGYTNYPGYAELNERLRAWTGEMIQMEYGQARVTAVQQMLRETPLGAGKARFRAIVRAAMAGGYNTVNQEVEAFHRTTGLSGDPPYLDLRTKQLFEDFVGSNPWTGTFHDEALPDLKSIEPTPEQRGTKRPSWLTKDMEYEPRSREFIDRLRATIEQMRSANPRDPRLKGLYQELGVLQ